MVYVLFTKKSDYLVTVGDSAASFLECPDPSTERMCIMSRDEIIDVVSDEHCNGKVRHNDELAAMVQRSRRTWTKQYRNYTSALDRDRQVGSSFM
jgi:hypothetical protein